MCPLIAGQLVALYLTEQPGRMKKDRMPIHKTSLSSGGAFLGLLQKV